MIKAEKNGIIQSFTQKQWDAIGTDKYGWVPIPEVPKEVAMLAGPSSSGPTERVSHEKGRPGRKKNTHAD